MKLFDEVTTSLNPNSECATRPLPPHARGVFRSGYQGSNAWSSTLYALFNKLVAALLIIATLPLFAVVALVIKLKDPGPIFYRGTRLGYNKQPFYMYKFRTLPVGAQHKIGAELLSRKHDMLTPVGKFLRDTRLDELPQLFNVLLGDMVFVGPRPIRPEVYEHLCMGITGYDARFAVRPGVIGYSQLFTPHSAPKRIRSLIDNRLALRKRNVFWDILIIGYTGAVLMRSFLVRGTNLVLERVIRTRLLRRYQETRAQERIKADRAQVFVTRDGEAEPAAYAGGRLQDINETHFRFLSNENLDGATHSFRLQRLMERGRRVRRKRAYAKGVVFRRLPGEGGFAHCYIVEYWPASTFNQYMLDKYFLAKSIV